MAVRFLPTHPVPTAKKRVRRPLGSMFEIEMLRRCTRYEAQALLSANTFLFTYIQNGDLYL